MNKRSNESVLFFREESALLPTMTATKPTMTHACTSAKATPPLKIDDISKHAPPFLPSPNKLFRPGKHIAQQRAVALYYLAVRFAKVIFG